MIARIATLRKFSRAGLLAITLMCVTALAGWLLDIPVLASVVPGWPRMAVIVMLCFLLCAAAAFEFTLAVRRNYLAMARIAAAAIVLAIGAYTVIDFVMASAIHGALTATNLFGPKLGRPSPVSGLNFILASIALMMPATARSGRIYSALIAAGLAITGFDFAGYAYDIAALSRGPTVSAMSLPTLISFILLFVAALLARPLDGWTAVISARNSGGVAARRLFPIMLVLPFVVSGLVVLAYRFHPFDAPFGFAVLAVLSSIGLCIATVNVATWLARHEDEQRRSQQLLEAIVDNSQAVIYVKDLGGRYLMVNQRYLDVFHFPRQAVIGKSDHDLFPKYEADSFRAMDQEVVRAGHAMTGEEIASQPDGYHTFLSLKAPLKDAAGQPYATFGVSTDITDRMRSQKALAASEEQMRLIVETALDAVISIDRNGAITGWNSQAEKIFGWTRDEALGKPIDETIMPERYRAGHKRGLARYLTTREARVLNRRIELTGLRRDGGEFPLELSITPIKLGEETGFTAFLRDITERKNAEARIQIQLERMALLERITHAVGQRQDIQSISQVVVRTLEDRLPADFVCICSHDPLKNEITVNHVGVGSAALAQELSSAEPAAIPVGQNGLSRCVKGMLVYEPDIANIAFPFPRLLARHGLRSLVMTPLMLETDVFGILAVARRQADSFASADCEFLKQLGEHVALAARQAELRLSLETAYNDLKQTQQAVMQQERLRALGQMASGIAHDINNAISPVAVYTQSLLEREPNLSPQTRFYLETVERVIKDVSATVARMRDFYRRNDSDNELQPLNLNDLVPQVVDLTRARWSDMPQQRGIVIRVITDLAQDLPWVMGNAPELRDMLTNLVFNAVDAMPQGGIITIRTQPHLDGVRLDVEDCGIGMDEDTRRHCLEPFFTTKGERGTGLGLAMVYGAAQRHKAVLDIESSPGDGTRVRLEFAATQTKPRQVRAAKAGDIPPLRVLLVDDDPAVLNSTQFVLELDGHAVVTANGGDAGIEALQNASQSGQAFDVMVTDLGMPYVDGNQVARRAKEMSPSTTVVLLTGWGAKMGDGDDRSAHVDFVLAKPFDVDELRSVFLRHVEARH